MASSLGFEQGKLTSSLFDFVASLISHSPAAYAALTLSVSRLGIECR